MKTIIYHITSHAEWQAAQKEGLYISSSLAVEGFIHCSTQKQVITTAESYYKGKTDLLLLCINQDLIKAQVRYDDSHNNGELFPHIYGPLTLNSVVKVVNLPPRPDGLFDWPKDALTE